MCGIAGFFNLNHRPENQDDSSELKAMTECLKHRGPDDFGYFIEGPIALGHARLSVIDIDGGHQPIFNEDRSIAVVCNGEIYNYREIRRQLEKQGHHFLTQSDTEVIVHLYEETGIDCVKSLRGMFAFALWDRKDKTLFLARDIVGKKPLYYTLTSDRLLFGSEIKSLLKVEDGGPLNFSGLDLFFKHQFIPGPETIYQKIKSLPPAHLMVFKQQTSGKAQLEIKRYWTAPSPSKRLFSDEEYCEILRETLQEAVNIRLISDVPLGAFLSGGLDSSVIVALMKSIGVSQLNTFSIGFKEGSFDETVYAQQVSKQLGTTHQDAQLDYQIEDLLPTLIDHFDQPFGDSSAIAVYRLSEMTRRSVTVALSGDGSDEIFAGYNRYVARKLVKYYQWIPRKLREKWIEGFLSQLPEGDGYYGDSIIKQFKLLAGFSRRIEEDPLALLPLTFTREELSRLYVHRVNQVIEKQKENQVAMWAEQFSHLDDISQMMWLDFHAYLPDDILVKVDRMSMAHGLEVRSPFLDQKVIECALKMPLSVKLKNLETKYILKKTFSDRLPSNIVHRKKHGFMVPLGAWFKKELRPFVEDILLKPDPMGLFNLEYITELNREHQRGFRDHSQKLWLLLVFRLWENRACQTKQCQATLS